MHELFTESCDWCPRRCGANRREGERGVCGIARSIRVARAAPHFWEEPPISGESGSGAVFFSGCSLHCVYCQNYDISDGAAGRDISLERLVEIYFELEAKRVRNINLVTPTHYGPIVARSIEMAKNQGMKLPFVWNTSGYETPEAIHMLNGLVKVYLTDFKYANSSLAARYSHAPDYPEVACAVLSEMLDQASAEVIVRHLLLPGQLEESKQALDLLASRFGTGLTLSLMNQYTPYRLPNDCLELSRIVSDCEYEHLLDYADILGFEDYFWQQGGTAEESFIPAFDCSGV